jgi:hypothetical protein
MREPVSNPDELPRRIQRSRAKGWKMPPNTVYVGRPTVWQNPYGLPGTNAMITGATREECVRAHREMVAGECASLGRVPGYIRELRGKHLACWCRLDQPCHADTLLRVANGPPMAFPEPTPATRIDDARQLSLRCEAADG